MKIQALAQHRSRITELAKLLHEEWGDFSPWSSVGLIEQRLLEASLDEVAPCAFLALSDTDDILGTASIKLRELADHLDKIHWIGEVFIRKDLRGQGIGSQLIRHCLQYAFANKIAKLFLYTPDQQALYRRFGWETIADITVNGEMVSIMVISPQC
jgi:GNAT superfamily N-acetyltransferase